MSGVDPGSLKSRLIIVATIDCEQSAAADSPAYHSVSPFPLRVSCIDSLIKRINFLRYKFVSQKQQYHYDNNLQDGLADDMLHHRFGNYMLAPAVRFPI